MDCEEGDPGANEQELGCEFKVNNSVGGDCEGGNSAEDNVEDMTDEGRESGMTVGD